METWEIVALIGGPAFLLLVWLVYQGFSSFDDVWRKFAGSRKLVFLPGNNRASPKIVGAYGETPIEITVEPYSGEDGLKTCTRFSAYFSSALPSGMNIASLQYEDIFGRYFRGGRVYVEDDGLEGAYTFNAMDGDELVKLVTVKRAHDALLRFATDHKRCAVTAHRAVFITFGVVKEYDELVKGLDDVTAVVKDLEAVTQMLSEGGVDHHQDGLKGGKETEELSHSGAMEVDGGKEDTEDVSEDKKAEPLDESSEEDVSGGGDDTEEKTGTKKIDGEDEKKEKVKDGKKIEKEKEEKGKGKAQKPKAEKEEKAKKRKAEEEEKKRKAEAEAEEKEKKRKAEEEEKKRKAEEEEAKKRKAEEEEKKRKAEEKEKKKDEGVSSDDKERGSESRRKPIKIPGLGDLGKLGKKHDKKNTDKKKPDKLDIVVTEPISEEEAKRDAGVPVELRAAGKSAENPEEEGNVKGEAFALKRQSGGEVSGNGGKGDEDISVVSSIPEKRKGEFVSPDEFALVSSKDMGPVDRRGVIKKLSKGIVSCTVEVEEVTWTTGSGLRADMMMGRTVIGITGDDQWVAIRFSKTRSEGIKRYEVGDKLPVQGRIVDWDDVEKRIVLEVR